MPETTEFAPGTFCWVDSGTHDLERAKEFYRAVFGWEYATADDTGYTMCLLGGKPVAGLYAYDEDMLAMGAPPCWTAYVAVADADTTMAKALAAGAQPMGPVFDVPGHGRGGAFADPSGAMCGIWQGGGHQGSGLAGVVATLSWCELQTRDPEASAAFYGAVFGWACHTMPMPDAPYYLFRDGEAERGGMMAITPAMGDVPPNWSVYFHVDDADATVAGTLAAGGTLVTPAIPVGSWGRMAVLRSADGAYFSILQSSPME